VIDALECERAQARAAVEIDRVGTTRHTDGDEQVALGVPRDARDRFGEVVELGLAAIDQREHVDAVRVLLRHHPDDALAAADGGDRRRARQPEPALGDARDRVPLLDRAGNRDDELTARGTGDGRLRACGELVGRQVRIPGAEDRGALRPDDERVRAHGAEQADRGRELDLGDRLRPVRIQEVDRGVSREPRQDEQARRRAEPGELVLGIGGDADLREQLAVGELDDHDALGLCDRDE
jgi:hypothetical protein